MMMFMHYVRCLRYKITEANITTDGYQSQLTISDVADDDFGMFNCTATNDYGTASLDITLSRRGANTQYCHNFYAVDYQTCPNFRNPHHDRSMNLMS